MEQIFEASFDDAWLCNKPDEKGALYLKSAQRVLCNLCTNNNKLLTCYCRRDLVERWACQKGFDTKISFGSTSDVALWEYVLTCL